MKATSVILLSGGLDSLVALGVCRDEYDIQLALTFDYGQKSVFYEIESSKEICDYYKIKHEIIKLDWLKNITQTSLVSSDVIPTDNLGTTESAKNVWVPNRNGLFLNIAASFADSFGYKNIIFGANKDEGATFSDNTEIFREKITETFKYSTLQNPKVVAPLINYTKDDIVRVAIDKHVPLEYVRSCYNSGEKHCGECESCKHLKNALINNCAYNYIDILFGE